MEVVPTRAGWPRSTQSFIEGDQSVILFTQGAIDFVIFVHALDRQVGRNINHFEIVDVHEFASASVWAVPVMPESLS